MINGMSLKNDLKFNCEIKLDFMMFVFSVLVILIALGRINNIYIEHDDWDFMLSPEFSQYATPWSKTLSEGRWITFMWSKIAINLSPSVLYVIFMSGYSLLCWRISLAISSGGVDRIIVALSLFACPLYSAFSSWPATTTPSVWVCLVSLSCLYRYSNSYIAYFIVAAVMALVYPPLGLVCLIFAGWSGGFTGTIFKCLSYFSGFIFGVLCIYTLNYAFHDHFGLIPEGWRNYHQIASIADLVINLKKAYKILIFFFEVYWLSLFLSIASIVYGVLNKNKHATSLLLIGLFCFGLDAALTTYTGMDVSDRNFIWPWFYMVACVGLLILNSNSTADRRHVFLRIVGLIILSVVFFYGMNTWRVQADYYNRVAKYVDMVGVQMDQAKDGFVLTCGEPKFIHGINIKMAVKKTHGIDVGEASADDCKKAINPGINKVDNKIIFIYP
ncbi:hypothetical protein [Enterobacter roggenkampii]|uniref:hypothetical protein n=1 Tax=Enterobacter roggenkampii TaxID=1812935 RepID=UPI002FD7C6C6